MDKQSTLTFLTESLPAMQVGQEYAEWLQVSGGTPPYSFALNGGTLPAGVEVTPAGTVNGVPLEPGDTSFSVQVTDSVGAHVTQTFDAEVSGQPDAYDSGIVSTGGPLTFQTEALPAFTVGQNYDFNIQAVGGTTPYQFQLAQGSLPQGIQLDADGHISGVPTQSAGSTAFIKLTDAAGDEITQAFDCEVG